MARGGVLFIQFFFFFSRSFAVCIFRPRHCIVQTNARLSRGVRPMRVYVHSRASFRDRSAWPTLSTQGEPGTIAKWAATHVAVIVQKWWGKGVQIMK